MCLVGIYKLEVMGTITWSVPVTCGLPDSDSGKNPLKITNFTKKAEFLITIRALKCFAIVLSVFSLIVKKQILLICQRNELTVLTSKKVLLEEIIY